MYVRTTWGLTRVIMQYGSEKPLLSIDARFWESEISTGERGGGRGHGSAGVFTRMSGHDISGFGKT